MPPSLNPSEYCAVICSSSFGVNARITRGEKPSDDVEPGSSVYPMSAKKPANVSRRSSSKS
jgi:hypothetical protein